MTIVRRILFVERVFAVGSVLTHIAVVVRTIVAQYVFCTHLHVVRLADRRSIVYLQRVLHASSVAFGMLVRQALHERQPLVGSFCHIVRRIVVAAIGASAYLVGERKHTPLPLEEALIVDIAVEIRIIRDTASAVAIRIERCARQRRRSVSSCQAVRM